MNNKKLSQQIHKYYWSHDQHLIVETMEMMEGKGRDCMFDVYLADGIYLFTVQNYYGFCNVRIADKTYFRKNKCRVVETWDGIRAACTPLYMNETFTLPKFTDITKEDIVNCTDYFVHEILQIWSLFNIKFVEEKNDTNSITNEKI